MSSTKSKAIKTQLTKITGFFCNYFDFLKVLPDVFVRFGKREMSCKPMYKLLLKNYTPSNLKDISNVNFFGKLYF